MNKIDTEIRSRLERFGLKKTDINAILSKNKVGVYRLDGRLELDVESYSKYIDSFLQKKVGMPYLVIESQWLGMRMLSIIFVSFDTKEWERERSELATSMGDEMSLFSYVYNLDYPELNEFGYIIIHLKDEKIFRVL